MRIVMDMSSYEPERDSPDRQYGEYVIFANWNPAVALSQQQPDAPIHAGIPADLATTNVELFLRRMYACQR